MVESKKIKISQFLKEREGRYDPTDSAVQNLKRLNKIDFSGEIHLSDKGSKTDMIIVEPGDLIISGINVSKGALAVYHGDEPITATIHYSSYIFDEDKIDIEYFKRFVKSQFFVQILKEQVKGGIKTEIKPKHFLSIEMHLPNIDTQKKIVSFFSRIENEMSELTYEITHQQTYLLKIRQQILQEAIEGKLTAEWRKEHPELINGKNHASKLLEKIKTEKERLIKEGKIKKDMSLLPITNSEKQFDLPDGWAWCRLGNIYSFIYGNSLPKLQHKDNGKYPVYGSNGIVGYYDKYLTCKRAIIVGRKGSAGALNISMKPSWTTDVAYYIEELENIDFMFMFNLLKSLKLEDFSKGIKPGINRNEIYSLQIPLPPLAEQQSIVDRVDKLMTMIDGLEKQVTDRKNQSEMLMQSVLREAFAYGGAQ